MYLYHIVYKIKGWKDDSWQIEIIDADNKRQGIINFAKSFLPERLIIKEINKLECEEY